MLQKDEIAGLPPTWETHETSLQCRVGFRSSVFTFLESYLGGQQDGIIKIHYFA